MTPSEETAPVAPNRRDRHARLEVAVLRASPPRRAGAIHLTGALARPKSRWRAIFGMLSLVFAVAGFLLIQQPELYSLGIGCIVLFLITTLLSLVMRVLAAGTSSPLTANAGRIIVGTDGTYIDMPSWRDLLSHHQVTSVTHAGQLVSFRMTWRDQFDVDVGDEAHAAALVARIRAEQERLDRRRKHRITVLDDDPPPSSADELAAWTERLAAALDENQAYRRASLPIDDLLSLVADPTAEPHARVGVAAALARAGHTRYRVAIEEAARQTANEPLRISLEEAAEGRLNQATTTQAANLNPTR